MSESKPRNKISSMLGGAGVFATVLIPLTVMPRHVFASAPIIVSGTVDLHFGSFTESGAGGTVVVTTAGARTVTGSVTEITGGGLERAGSFNVSGSTGLAMDVDVTPTSVNISNGGDTMVVNNFNLVSVAGGDSNVITLAAPSSAFAIGATLNVGSGQASGVYTGHYTLTVDYQ